MDLADQQGFLVIDEVPAVGLELDLFTVLPSPNSFSIHFFSDSFICAVISMKIS